MTIISKISKQALIKTIEKIRMRIASRNFPTNRELIEICTQENICLIGEGNEPHLIHEILETAVNRHLAQVHKNNSISRENRCQILAELENLTKKLPPQSWRSNEQKKYQQFSTPPAIAFVMTQMLKPEKGKTALEPSAGTGCLAVWLTIAGCRTFVNEISESRRGLLQIQGYQPAKVDAEFLDDLLDEEIKPDFVLMNPPFSTSGGRCKKTDSDFGFRHVKSALARLKKGGRLVALLGSDTITKTDKGRKFLNEIAAEYDLKAVISLPANAFYKYGTNFQTCIVCIEKNQQSTEVNECKKTKSIIEADCRSLEECLSFAHFSTSKANTSNIEPLIIK
ncbi:MAG: SAM-dependent DNA methyltransferase [Acidobacteria bacterium]|nr:SAM-dependent DNA methyltransferase [Acidobacteriota bacterium]